MLNSYSNAYNNLKINAVSGTLVKSHPKSFIISYYIECPFGKNLNDAIPKILKDGRLKTCVIIQTMLVSDKRLMSEIVWLDDYLESEEK